MTKEQRIEAFNEKYDSIDSDLDDTYHIKTLGENFRFLVYTNWNMDMVYDLPLLKRHVEILTEAKEIMEAEDD